MIKIVFISLVAVAVTFKAGYLLNSQDKEKFISRVTLDEDCELETKSFAIKNLTTGEIRSFEHGEAFIRASENDIFKVVLNEKYSQVRFNGREVKANKYLKIVQTCENPTTLTSIFESFNDTFSTD